MTTSTCRSPLEWDTLLAYWLGELDPGSEAHIEEHYLGCDQCSQRLEQLTTLAQGIRELTQSSSVAMVINDAFMRRLRQAGLSVREYRVPQNGSVNCTVTPEDDFVVGRLEAPLAGVQRVDMITLFSIGNNDTEQRQNDIPFIADNGDVVFAPSIAMLRALPVSTLRVRLLAVDDNGERTLGDYTFNHTPYRSD